MNSNKKKNVHKKNWNHPVIILSLITFLLLGWVEFMYLYSQNSTIYTCNSANTAVCKTVENDYESEKKNDVWMTGLIKKLVVTGDNLLEASGLGEDDGTTVYEGLTDQNTNFVYINASEYTGKETLKHEMYHLVDYTLGNKAYGVPKNVKKILEGISDENQNSLSKSKAFKKMIEKNVEEFKDYYALSEYEVSSYQEAFVSMMMEYEENPLEMKANFSDMAKYSAKVNKIINILNKE